MLVGWLWYLGTLVPMIGLVPIGDHARADRYTYLPQIGLCIAVVWGVRWGVERSGAIGLLERWLYGVGGTLLVAGLMACAWQQTSYWHDSERLWTHALACTSQNPLADNNLGKALADRGQVDEAIAHFRRALEIKPDYVWPTTTSATPWPAADRSTRPSPITARPWKSSPTTLDAHYNLALALAGRGQVDEAIAHYRKALEIKPDYAEAHYNLGNVLAGRGQVDEAIAQYRKALEIKPDYAEAYNNLGDRLGRPRTGRRGYRPIPQGPENKAQLRLGP